MLPVVECNGGRWRLLALQRLSDMFRVRGDATALLSFSSLLATNIQLGASLISEFFPNWYKSHSGEPSRALLVKLGKSGQGFAIPSALTRSLLGQVEKSWSRLLLTSGGSVHSLNHHSFCLTSFPEGCVPGSLRCAGWKRSSEVGPAQNLHGGFSCCQEYLI